MNYIKMSMTWISNVLHFMPQYIIKDNTRRQSEVGDVRTGATRNKC